jgi:hypothetical protein
VTPVVDRDILIARVIDAEASPEDWASIRALAERDPSIWSELAAAQQDQADLASALAEATRVAEEVTLPVAPAPSIVLRRRLSLAGAAGGWLAAAAMLLAWWVQPGGSGGVQGDGQQAGIVPSGFGATADEALQAYLDRGVRDGRIVGVEPDFLIRDSRPLDDGSGVEIVYVRRIVERMVVDKVYRASLDERGLYVPVPVQGVPTGRRRM